MKTAERFSRRIILHLTALLAYLLATLVFTWPLALQLHRPRSPATASTAGRTTGICGGSRWRWWSSCQPALHRSCSIHPTGVGLYFHTLNPFNGLWSTLPIQLAFGLIPAYNAVVLLSWTLAATACFS
jgi:hypothetical protein